MTIAHAELAALLERVRSLSDEELGALASEWKCPVRLWTTAFTGARSAALFYSRDYEWAAVADSVVGDGCSWDIALSVSLDAAWALLMRDVVGEYPRWDWVDYDLLSGPFRRAVGRIHPTDPEV